MVLFPSQTDPTVVSLLRTSRGGSDDTTPVALPVLASPEGPTLGPGHQAYDADVLFAALQAAGATGRPGEATPTLADGDRPILLVGVGDGGGDDLRRAGAALARATRGRDRVATTITRLADRDGLRSFVQGVVLGGFVFSWRSRPEPRHQALGELAMELSDGLGDDDLDQARTIAYAGWQARRLATVPSNVKNPAWLAAEAERLLGDRLTVRVWEEKELERDGFGGILAVGAASATPPRLIRVDHRPKRSRKAPHVVLVGKGITFDSGGLSIKPADAMASMKRDMTGGGVVLAAIGALAELDCPLRVTALVPAAENAISGSAMRPGDVIAHYGGRTSEINNTDAEGRLVMADALAYAAKEIEPDLVIDVATLTGAMKVALGLRTGGYFATSDGIAARLEQASARSGERFWRMPLAQEYQSKLAAKVGDADNAAGGPGAITAALFLEHFTGGLPWAHLDVASVGDAPEDWDEYTAGPTGFGARTLVEWLMAADPIGVEA